jgi:hypothetical protein
MAFVMTMALAGGATFALFTSNASNAGKDFTAGTVKIAAGGTTFSDNITIGNMAPGDVKVGSFVISNTSSLPIYIQVTGNKGVVQGKPSMWEHGGTVLPDGQSWMPLAANQNYTFNYTVAIDPTATTQGMAGTLSFKVDAEQQANNTKTFANWTGTWNTSPYADIQFTQTGNNVVGTASWSNLTGTVLGNTLVGEYTFPGGPGKIHFTITTDGTHFTGQWLDPDGQNGTWNGTRG